jgi:hypothetical protein
VEMALDVQNESLVYNSSQYEVHTTYQTLYGDYSYAITHITIPVEWCQRLELTGDVSCPLALCFVQKTIGGSRSLPSLPEASLFRNPLAKSIFIQEQEGTRLQLRSDSLSSMAFQCQHLLKSSNVISHEFPYEDYFSVVEKHFAIRAKLKQCIDEVERLSLQLFEIQKCLLIKYQEKSPVSTSALKILYKEAYSEVS